MIGLPVADAEHAQRSAVDGLVALLTLDAVAPDYFRAPATDEAARRLFGGQVVAQALGAAIRSVGQTAGPGSASDAARPAHSLHAYFLRPGDPAQPVDFHVMRDFDGGSFTNRRVVALQADTPILNLTASFHRMEAGLTHAAPAPQVPPPEACPTLLQMIEAAGRKPMDIVMDRMAAFELRPVPPRAASTGATDALPAQCLWFRLATPGPDAAPSHASQAVDGAMARVILTYFSDFSLLTTAVLPHPIDFFSPRLQAASLDHAVWFHADPPVNEWLLYAMDSPWSGAGRGFARGMVFDTAGRLIASMTQEGLIRVREKA